MAANDVSTPAVWTVEELAYLAGIIDGEGTICIARGKDSRKVHKHYYYIPHMKVCNTDLELMKWIHETFGGRMNNTRHETDKWHTLYYVRWNLKKAEKVLTAIYPYLRVKKRQATVLLEMIGRMGTHSFRGVLLSDHERNVRAMLYDLMARLNRKGRKDLPLINIEAERLSEETTEVLRLVRQSDLAGIQPQETDRNVQSA
jgi:hypothetical protein